MKDNRDKLIAAKKKAARQAAKQSRKPGAVPAGKAGAQGERSRRHREKRRVPIRKSATVSARFPKNAEAASGLIRNTACS